MTPARLKSYSDRATWIALAGGVALFAWLVWKVDTRPLVAVFRDSGHWVVAIALLYGLFQCAYCMGWRETLRPCPVPFGRLLGLYQAGDTLSYVVPLAGEPLKARLLRPAYTTTQGLFSVSVAKFCEAVAQLLFYVVGLTWTLFAFPLPGRVRLAGVAIFAALLVGLAVLFRMQRKGLYGPALGFVERLVRRSVADETREKVRQLDEMISRFYAERPGAFARAVAWKFVGKLGGVAEALLVLRLFDRPPELASAFAIETLSMIANDLVFFVPGRVGGAEGGRVLVFVMLGFSAAEGLTYAMIRRIRELLWVGLGFVYLWADRWSRRRKIRVVLFDFDGTLDADGLPRRDRLFSELERRGLCSDRRAFDHAWLRAESQLKRWPQLGRQGLKATLSAQVEAVWEELRLNGDRRRPDVVEALLKEAAPHLERSREVLQRLKGRYRVAILDNHFGNLGLVCLESGLSEAVELVVDSGTVGFEKPDPEIFEYALKKLGVSADEAVYVGDSPEEDLRGARAAGLRHVWLRPPGRDGSRCCWDDREIGSIEEIERAVDGA